MKILYIANARIPTEKAHGIQIMNMCRAFGNIHEVELIVPKRKNHIRQDAFEYYGIPPNFRMRKLGCLDLTGIIPALGFWIQSLSFFIAAKIFLDIKKDGVLYSREFLTGLFFKNYVLEIHTLPKRIRSIHLRVWQKAQALIVITRRMKDMLARAGIAEEKILVAPDGVDVERFKIYDLRFKNKYREELGLPTDKKIVMYTGHLYDWKGAGTLLQAAKNFQFTPTLSPPYQGGDEEGVFVFVGGTEKDIARFKKQAEGLDNVLILGQKPHSEIPKYLAAADVLLLPNSGKKDISRYYTSPIKLFEYMASGRPIVASDLPSIVEILNDQNSVLVEADDPEALARGINSVLEDEQLAKRIADAALENVKQYDWNARAKKILEFIS